MFREHFYPAMRAATAGCLCALSAVMMLAAVSSAGAGGGGASHQTTDEDGRGSYEHAMVELSQGRPADAQRRLEALIAAHPDSPYADAARAKMVELYTAPVRGAQRSQLGVRPEHATGPALQPWTVEVQRAPLGLDEFRAVIGDRVFFAQGSAERNRNLQDFAAPRPRGHLRRTAEAGARRLRGHSELVDLRNVP